MKYALLFVALLVVSAHASLDLSELTADIDDLSVDMESKPQPQQFQQCQTCSFCRNQCQQKYMSAMGQCGFQPNAGQCMSAAQMAQWSCMSSMTSYCPYASAPADVSVATQPKKSMRLQESKPQPQQMRQCQTCSFCRNQCQQKFMSSMGQCGFQPDAGQCMSAAQMAQWSCMSSMTSYCPYASAPADVSVATQPKKSMRLQESKPQPQQFQQCSACSYCRIQCQSKYGIALGQCNRQPNASQCNFAAIMAQQSCMNAFTTYCPW